MAKISTYPIISIPTFNDLLIGTDVLNLNETKNFTIGDIADLIIVGNYVPYIGAIDDVDLGIHSITASSFIVPGGLATQFVKADGSLDSTVYQPAGNYITGLSGEATASGPGVSAVVLDNGAVIGKVLTGLTITGGSISSSDSILQAFGKLQNQVNGLYGGAIYQGTWNALTNTPTLTSGVGVQGYYYIVSVAGNTVLDGISDWNVGDWAIFDGTAWQQVDNTDTVVSVNGQVGIVVLTTTDIAEGTNLYYTDTRARASLTLTTTGSSGASTYNNLTGAFNIPNYTLSGLGGVPSTRQLSINGTAYDLSADRSWSVGTVTSIGTSGPLTGGTITGSGTIGITQSGVASDGYLSSVDWNTFNNKQNALVNPVTGTGTVYYIPLWTGVSALGDSIISYSSNVVNYNYNSASGATVNYINTNGTAYTYTIQMNNVGTRQTYHSYTDGNIIQRINSNDVSRNLQSGQLVLPYYTATGSFTGTSVGYLGFDALGNVLTVPVPSLTGYVPYIGATATVDLGDNDLEAGSVFVEGASGTGGALRIKQFASSAANLDGYSTISTLNTGVFYFTAATTSPNFKNFVLNPSGLTDNTLRTYTLPNLDGTLALLSDIPSLTGYVPYTGATQDVNLGEFGLTAGQLTLDISPTGTAVVGTTRWNNTLGSSETLLKGGSVLLKNGVDLVARVVNKVFPNATLTKAAYQAVRVSGAQGQRLAVAYAQANNDANSADTFGLVTETIPTNQEGFIICVGQLENINTTGSLQGETWVDGDVLYLSPTVPGGITNIKPLAPQHLVVIGYVEYAHVNNGKIYVKIMNGWELGELHDVNTTGVVAGQVLKYNGTIWTPSADAGITGSGATGQVAYWNGTGSQTGSNNLFWDAANARLGIGTNVPTSTLDIRGKTRIQASGNCELDFNDGSQFLRIGVNSTSGFLQTLTSIPLGFFTGATKRGEFSTNGNFILQNGGTFTDGGQRLQVMGDAFIKGSGATSATIGLQIQNSGGSPIFQVRNDSVVIYGGANTGIFCSTDKGQTITGGAGGMFLGYFATGDLSYVDVPSVTLGRPNNRLLNATSGTQIMGSVVGNFSPTSGTGLFRAFEVVPTINQTGGANGITRGLYVNPTLTAAADWRSIEWSNNSGWGLYGAGTANNYLGGSLGIGSANLSNANLAIEKNISGSTSAYGVLVNSVIQSGVTANAYGFRSILTTQAASFTLSNIFHFVASQTTQGAGSIVTTQIGYECGDMNNGYTNIAYRGQISQGTLSWNLYMNGTASNYLAGQLLIGTTTKGTFALDVNGTARVSGDATFSTNVGIGISPLSRLHISGAGDQSIILQSTSTGTTTSSYIKYIRATTGSARTWWTGVGIQGGGDDSYSFYDQTAVAERMRITAGGNLLVGTTADQGYRVQITGSGDNMLNVWGATAPSIRLDNAASGATQRFLLGLATATNNFIQGASAGDVCITTATASPIVFGMWQTSTASEVMRITTSNNLLINKTADGGQKLQVSGKVNFASLPTSSAGLSAGDIWNNGGVLNIV